MSDLAQDMIFEFDGAPVFTGNLTAGEKEITLTTFADGVGVLTKDQIADIVNDPNRKQGRNRWPSSHIKNQGKRGSCNAYAIAGALEKSRELRGLSRVQLGPEFLYAQINGGRDQGSGLKNGWDAAEKIGIPPVEFVQYESYLKSQQSPEAVANAGRFRILSGEAYGIHSDEELASALALNFMCVVACHVTNDWMKLDGDGVVYPTDGMGNHAIHCDDVRINSKGEYEFDHAGSWATRYGQNGRGWTSWKKHYRTPSRYHQFYAVRSTTDDPNDPKKPPKKAQ